MSAAERPNPQHWLMKETSAWVVRGATSGATRVSLLCSETILMGSMLLKDENQSLGDHQVEPNYTHVNGSVVYWENIVAMILLTIASFVLSRPVISIKTFVVFRERSSSGCR